MKATFPYFGDINAAFEAFGHLLGVDEVIPPFSHSLSSIEDGVRESNELICFPYKAVLGNIKNSLDRGAEIVVMGSARGPCRFGHYFVLLSETLENMGYKFIFLRLQPQKGKFLEFFKNLKFVSGNKPYIRIFWALCCAVYILCSIEKIKELSAKIMPKEQIMGNFVKLKNEILDEFRKVKTLRQAIQVKNRAIQRIKSIKIDNRKQVAKIMLVGEIYTCLCPSLNFNMEEYLSGLGVEVYMPNKFSKWVLSSFMTLREKRSEDPVSHARPFLNHYIGGEGRESVGYTVMAAEKGFDGVIHLYPEFCMPEIVARSVMDKVAKRYNIPLLHMAIDEKTLASEIYNRLETFIDVIKAKA